MSASFSSSKSTPADWEKSLANIIQRTNSNLNQMNTRYSGGSGPIPTPGSRYSGSMPPPRHGGGSPVVMAPSRAYVNQNLPPAAPSSSNFAGAKDNDQKQQAVPSAQSADQIEANVMKQVRQLVSDKFVIVERSVDSLRQQIVGLSSEVSR